MDGTCHYTISTTTDTWSGITGCSWRNRDCCNSNSNCCSCKDKCVDVEGLVLPFRKALDHLLLQPVKQSCNKKQVIGIDCSNTSFNFEGHLFVNNEACNKLNNDLRPTPENIISNCKCNCDCHSVYCKLNPNAINISTSVKPISSKPTTTATSPTTTEKKTRTADTTRTEEKTTTHVDTTKTTTTETIATSLSEFQTHQPSPTHTSDSFPQHATSSGSTAFTKQAFSEDNSVSGAMIGGAVVGVIILLILAVLLLILIRRHRGAGKKSKKHDSHNNRGTFVNNAYEAEMDMNFMNSRLEIRCASNGFDAGPETRRLSDNEQEYTKTTIGDKSQTYENVEVTDKLANSFSVQSPVPENGENPDDYEFAKPISENNTDNYFELEPQSRQNDDVENGGENYFVLEEVNRGNGARDIDDVYNTLNEDMKTHDDHKDEYHHLRDISRSGREGTNPVDEDDDDYDMLQNGVRVREDFFNDDYDHCKPRKFANDEDDYDHFT